MDTEEKLPMDNVEEGAPPPQQDNAEQQAQEQRTRDEAGRFAPKGDARGKPDETAARRREAQERDDARRDAADARAAHAALQKRFDDMAALAKGEEPKDENPDPLKPILEKIEGIDKRLTSRDQEAQAETAWNNVRSFADQDEQRFVQTQPDFPNAVQHYITSRIGEMHALGIDQAQAENVLQQEAQTLLVQCAQANRSPAEAIYAMAKARGYSGSPGAAPAPQQQYQTPQPNAGGRSFGTGAGPASGGVTAAQIAGMGEADYMAFRNTPEGKRAIQRAMGG
ncbi:MAG: hypothetical protein WC889_02840 [Myxococcota bacterium]|jgi:hypothetical protein